MAADRTREEEEIMAEKEQPGTTLDADALAEPISSLSLQPPVKVTPVTLVVEAARRMVEGGVGCVLVEDGGRLVGILTERDILTKLISRRLDVDRTPVETVMTRDPNTLSPDAGIAYALNEMTVGGFRHIPLVDGAGRAVGMVSMRNIVHHLVDLFPTEVLNLPPEPGLNIARTKEGA